MEDPEDTSGVISVDDIDFEYLNTEVHLGDVSGKPDCGRVYFLSVGIQVSEDIAEEDGEFNKLDGCSYGKSRQKSLSVSWNLECGVVKFRKYSIH
jgi:hypothetical protein